MNIIEMRRIEILARRAGTPVTVYERNCTRADGLQGCRVGISPTAAAPCPASSRRR